MNSPALSIKFFEISFVTFHVAVELILPEVGICFGDDRVFAAMTVPEAAVDKNGCFFSGKGNVRLAQRLRVVKSVPEAVGCKVLPHP